MTIAAPAPVWPLPGLEPYRFAEGDLGRLLKEGILDEGCELADGIVVRDGEPYRFSIGQYFRMGELELVPEKLPTVVLLEGLLTLKGPKHPPHAYTVGCCSRLFCFLLPDRGWSSRCQNPILLDGSAPQPDNSVVCGSLATYKTRHPSAEDTCLAVEVADVTLHADRVHMGRIYGSAGIPVYWIVNLVDRQVEVMTQPTATGYATRMDYLPGEAVPVVLDGVHVGDLLVDDLLP
ncbi:MAG: Uma2 family endonuclease [Gemmataceae bacterium]|nr:Uma2 family endonuclease [Gemmataceae bacterium]